MPTPPPFSPPPPRKSNAGLVIGLIAGVLALVVVVGAVLYVALGSDDKDDPAGPGTPPPSASTSAPVASGNLKLVDVAPSAGGWPRDIQAEQQLSSEISRQRETFTTRTQGKLDNVVTAFYKDPTGTPLGTRPAGVFWVGAEGTFGDPAVFVNSIRNSTAGTALEIDPGPGGGKGVCQTITSGSITLAWCAWATPRTIGMLFPSVPGRSAADLAEVLRRMRPDLEKSQ